jgi:hypothetical protein
MKNNVPILALLIGYAGAITNILTEAKSVIGFFTAIASLIASIYAIAISHQRLKAMARNRFAAKTRTPSRKPPRPSGLTRRPVARLAKTSVLSVSLWLVPLFRFTGCSHVATNRDRADKALTQGTRNWQNNPARLPPPLSIR